jgi:transposase InsO family protein
VIEWIIKSAWVPVPVIDAHIKVKAILFSSLKTERTAMEVYRSRDEARADVFDYVECFYNPNRRHATIVYKSPINFEREAGVA